MDSPTDPGLREDAEAPTVQRLVGGVLFPAGLLLVVVGIVRLANSDPGVAGPGGLLLFGLGVLMAVVGFVLLARGHRADGAGHAAGECVAMLEESPEDLRAGPHCRGCGVRNDEAARFCGSCGHQLG